jgi:hypothetical protein
MFNVTEKRYWVLRIEGVYAFLCGQMRDSTKIVNIPALVLLPAPPAILADLSHRPRYRVCAEQLRDFFSETEYGRGRKAAFVLRHASDTIRIGTVNDMNGQIEYGIDALGPYRMETPRKRRFRRPTESVRIRVSFEEICLHSDHPSAVMEAVLHLLDATIKNLMPKSGGVVEE